MSRIYQRRISSDGVINHYYITVPDSDGGQIEVEVCKEVFDTLEDLQRDVWRLEKADQRHVRHLEMMFETELPELLVDMSAEDILDEKFRAEEIKEKLRKLSAKQLRRFLLRDMLGYPIKHIATLEGCSEDSIKESLSLARKKLRRIFSE